MDANRVNNTINTATKHWLVPNKFLFRYPLRNGALSYAILMIIVMVCGIIVGIVEMASFKTCEDNSRSVKRSAYGFSTMTIIYCALMILINMWYIWAVIKNKASVVLVWVVATSFWLVLTTFLVIVMLCFYIADTSFGVWITCVVFGIVALVVAVYGVLVGFGLWVELKAVVVDIDTSSS